MIPKIIHYCWFGKNPLPELASKCIESWKKFCPDYQIIEWNETNFDVNYCEYSKEAYQEKKWAFVSDVSRLYALVNCGGIYMDTDVEVLKPLDEFLNLQAFSGFEAADRLPTGIMAAEKGQELFVELLKEYDNIHFKLDDGSLDTTTNVTRITNTCLKYGAVLNNTKQTVKGFTLFPFDYFCPKDSTTKIVNLTKNSYTIHHFDGSWLTEEDRLYEKIYIKRAKFMPKKLASYSAKFYAIRKIRGLKAAIKEVFAWKEKRSKK